MLALANICSSYNIPFYYYTSRPVENWLKTNPVGNYKTALDLGMILVDDDSDRLKVLVESVWCSDGGSGSSGSSGELIISQGGAMSNCSGDFTPLASEILEYISCSSSSSSGGIGSGSSGGNGSGSDWKIIVESGTGTTALFLAQALYELSSSSGGSGGSGGNSGGGRDYSPSGAYKISSSGSSSSGSSSGIACPIVVAVPVVGPPDYLRQQMVDILSTTTTTTTVPPVLTLPPNLKILNISSSDSMCSDGSNYVFGKPYSEHYLIHQNLVDETSIDFDLIYMPRCVELVFGSGGGNIISSSGSSGSSGGGIMLSLIHI